MEQLYSPPGLLMFEKFECGTSDRYLSHHRNNRYRNDENAFFNIRAVSFLLPLGTLDQLMPEKYSSGTGTRAAKPDVEPSRKFADHFDDRHSSCALLDR